MGGRFRDFALLAHSYGIRHWHTVIPSHGNMKGILTQEHSQRQRRSAACPSLHATQQCAARQPPDQFPLKTPTWVTMQSIDYQRCPLACRPQNHQRCILLQVGRPLNAPWWRCSTTRDRHEDLTSSAIAAAAAACVNEALKAAVSGFTCRFSGCCPDGASSDVAVFTSCCTVCVPMKPASCIKSIVTFLSVEGERWLLCSTLDREEQLSERT